MVRMPFPPSADTRMFMIRLSRYFVHQDCGTPGAPFEVIDSDRPIKVVASCVTYEAAQAAIRLLESS